jgi:hypothetical protein
MVFHLSFFWFFCGAHPTFFAFFFGFDYRFSVPFWFLTIDFSALSHHNAAEQKVAST